MSKTNGNDEKKAYAEHHAPGVDVSKLPSGFHTIDDLLRAADLFAGLHDPGRIVFEYAPSNHSVLVTRDSDRVLLLFGTNLVDLYVESSSTNNVDHVEGNAFWNFHKSVHDPAELLLCLNEWFATATN